MATVGLLTAILALLAWTIGDYSIEQSTRRVGDWKTLFFIGLFGFVFITPFIWRDILRLFGTPTELYLLLFLSFITLLFAILVFEGLKKGKLSIIEPVFGLELPAAILFSIFLGGEHLDRIVYILCSLVFIGLMLTVMVRPKELKIHRIIFEKGVIIAAIGAVGMGLMDFMTGFLSRSSSPLVTIWFLHAFVGVLCFIYLMIKGESKNLFKDIKNNPRPFLGVGIFDNLGWVAYAYSMVFIPISIATTISESYIALTVLIGIFINKEKIKKHQVVGIVLAIGAVLTLAYLTTS